jgi:hypothetical protein
MTGVYKFARIIVLLYAGILVWMQSDELADLRKESKFWMEVSYETAKSALVLYKARPCAGVRTQ